MRMTTLMLAGVAAVALSACQPAAETEDAMAPAAGDTGAMTSETAPMDSTMTPPATTTTPPADGSMTGTMPDGTMAPGETPPTMPPENPTTSPATTPPDA